MNDKMENCINGFRFYYMNQWIDQMTRYVVCSQVRKAFMLIWTQIYLAKTVMLVINFLLMATKLTEEITGKGTWVGPKQGEF